MERSPTLSGGSFWFSFNGPPSSDTRELQDARRRGTSADARPGSSSRDAGLAEIMPGRKARFAGKEPRLGTDNEDRVVEAGCQNRFLKRKMLKQVQTNLWANSENGGPLTDNVVLKSVQRFLDFKRTAVL